MSKKHREHKVDKSEHIPQREKIKEELRIRELNWTEKQKKLISLILDKNTNIVFISGPAGSSKSICAIYSALKLLADKKISSIKYLRTAIESSTKSLGYLSGDKIQKMEPYLEPCLDKLEELLPQSQINNLITDKRIEGDVINYARGRQANNQIWIADETQNFVFSEIVTFITRIGKFSKLILCGDLSQSDINSKSGYKAIIDIFNDEESRANGIHVFEFTKEDIMRSGTVKFIVEKLEKRKEEKHNESMFPTS